jgi:hypothetical protein
MNPNRIYIIRRPSFCADLEELKARGAISAKDGGEMAGHVRWIRSYVAQEAGGRLGTFCIHEAKDGAAIRDHARRAGLSGEEFYPVATTVVVRPDPVEAVPA